LVDRRVADRGSGHQRARHGDRQQVRKDHVSWDRDPLRQGVQFGSWAFTDRAKASGLVPSMGSVGDRYDNSMIESFWSRMQVELLDRKKWKTRVELANAMFDYLEIWHNRRPPPQPTRLAYADRVRAQQHHHRGMRIQESRIGRTRGRPEVPSDTGRFVAPRRSPPGKVDPVARQRSWILMGPTCHDPPVPPGPAAAGGSSLDSRGPRRRGPYGDGPERSGGTSGLLARARSHRRTQR
jgi:hypothetical protein